MIYLGELYGIIIDGSVAEWLKAHDSKSCGRVDRLGGSNPLASATTPGESFFRIRTFGANPLAFTMALGDFFNYTFPETLLLRVFYLGSRSYQYNSHIVSFPNIHHLFYHLGMTLHNDIREVESSELPA